MKRQAYAKVDEHRKTTTAVCEADKVKGNLDRKRRMTDLTGKLCLLQCPKDAGSVACVHRKYLDRGRCKNSESSWWRIQVDRLFQASDFYSSSSQHDFGKVSKDEVPKGTNANAKLAGHSDGFRVGDAVPNIDMTAGDEDSANFCVSFMAKNGLVALSTWNAAAAPPQEEMYTMKEWDKHERLGNLAVRTQVDHVLETAKDKSCRVEENTFMSTDLKAVFLETDMSKEEKNHTKKTNIRKWKPSPQWVKISKI